MRRVFFFYLSIICIAVQGQSIIDWQSVPFTSSYTNVSVNISDVEVNTKGAKSGQVKPNTTKPAVCLTKADSAFVAINFGGKSAHSLSFYWQQAYSTVTDASVYINGEIAGKLQSDGTEVSATLFEYVMHEGDLLNNLDIEQNSDNAGQISIGNIHVLSAAQFSPAFSYGDLVVSEFMADPSPSVYLPECEYVELFNASGKDLNLADFTLYINENKATLPSVTLNAENCIVLHEGGLGTIPNSSIVSLPAITNSEGSFSIYHQTQLIYFTQYKIKDFHDNIKSDGGWSLEKQNVSSAFNEDYQFSLSPNGGSPGSTGNRTAENEPLIQLDRSMVLSYSAVKIWFTHQADSSSISPMSVSANGKQATAVYWDAPEYRSAKVLFDAPVDTSVVIDVCIADFKSYYSDILRSECIPSAFPHSPKVGEIVVNELLPDPLDGVSEYIELKNIGSYAINLSDIRVVALAETANIESVYTVVDSDRLLFPDSVILLTEDTANLTGTYTCSCPQNFFLTENLPSLTNDGACIGITNRSLQILDSISYTKNTCLSAINDLSGVGLERTETLQLQAASSSCGYGTPGCENSQLESAEWYEETISLPDYFNSNEGPMHITINNLANTPADLYIYNEFGSLAIQLANKDILGANSIYIWSGVLEDGNNATPGIYIILLQTYDGSRKSLAYKKATVLLRE